MKRFIKLFTKDTGNQFILSMGYRLPIISIDHSPKLFNS